MEPAPRPSFSPAGAGGVLVGTLGAVIVVGLLVGAIVGIPVAIAAVYRRYRGFFT